jgi:hypothetical protein
MPRAPRLPETPGHHVIDSFTGYLPMFLAAGFGPTRESGRRTIVRRRLGAVVSGDRHGSTR